MVARKMASSWMGIPASANQRKPPARNGHCQTEVLVTHRAHQSRRQSWAFSIMITNSIYHIVTPVQHISFGRGRECISTHDSYNLQQCKYVVPQPSRQQKRPSQWAKTPVCNVSGTDLWHLLRETDDLVWLSL